MAAASKVAHIVVLGDIANMRVDMLRQVLSNLYGKDNWFEVALWVLRKKINICVTKRLLEFKQQDYIVVMGEEKFRNAFNHKMLNIPWKKQWDLATEQNRDRMKQKNYSLNMLAEWMTPPTKELLPELNPQEKRKMRYLHLIRAQIYIMTRNGARNAQRNIPRNVPVNIPVNIP